MVGQTSQTILEKIVANSQLAVSNLRVKSALNPMLWLCGIVSIPCFVLSFVAHGVEPLATMMIYIGAVPVLRVCPRTSSGITEFSQHEAD
jgi:hypothetical protein